MTQRTKYLLLFSSLSVGGFILFLMILRLTHLGVVIIPIEPTDPSGIGMFSKSQWRVWNFWPTPVNLDIVGKTCACVSCDTGDGPVRFGRARTVSVVASAVGKGHVFEERVVLQVMRGRRKRQRVIRIGGRGFVGINAWPDAVNVPKDAKEPYSEVIRVRFHRDIAFQEIDIHVTDESVLQTQWLSEPELVEDGSYAEVNLKLTVIPRQEVEEYMCLLVRGIPVKKLRVFCEGTKIPYRSEKEVSPMG